VRILGIDPGTARMGYGIVDEEGFGLKPVSYGLVSTQPGQPLAQRLVQIYYQLNQLLDSYQPEAVAIEELFFNKNVTTAIAVGQARGIALLVAATRELEIFEFNPMQVKLSLTGQGRAQKEQVSFMVCRLLGLAEAPQPDDVTDALAIAICGLHQRTAAKWMGAGKK
jgi:crossover junction endodeoxyribonuclease RuvC